MGRGSYANRRIAANEPNPEAIQPSPPRAFYWQCSKHKGSAYLTPVKGKFVVPKCPCCRSSTVTKIEKIKQDNGKLMTFKGPYCDHCQKSF